MLDATIAFLWPEGMSGLVYADSEFDSGKASGAMDLVYATQDGFITAGKKEGPWIEFCRKKRLYLKGNYKDGKRDGSWAAYWSNGQLVHQATFKNGARQGNWNDYITGGNVAKMFATTSPRRREGNCLIVE